MIGKLKSLLIKNKLKIIRGKSQGSKVQFNDKDADSVIEVSFNPTDYSVKKSNDFSEVKIPGLTAPLIQFNQGSTRTLNMELLLDTYSTTDPANIKGMIKTVDVRKKYIEKFEKLIAIDSELHAPPPCKVVWGSLDFVGILDSLDKKYILFDSDGIPVRARVTLSFKEYIPVETQVKGASTASPDRRKLFRVSEGDNIWLLADKAYGDPALWRVIAEANHIDDPKELALGRELIIPVLTR